MSEERLRELMRDATDGIKAQADVADRTWRMGRSRHRGPWLAVAASVACAATVVGLVLVADRSDDEPSAAVPSDSATDAGKEPRRSKKAVRVTASDRRTVRDFVAFAKHPEQARPRVRFAPDGVAIGLGYELARTLKGAQVDNSAAWTIRRSFWRGWAGPFSALETLRRNGDVPLNTIVGRQGRCAMVRSKPPDRLEGLRRIAVEPRPVKSCIDWFEVALYVDAKSRIRAVTLDLWEP